MGYYIQGPERGKGKYLEEEYHAVPCNVHEAYLAVGHVSLVPVCVVDNGAFDAAAVAYSSEEFECFSYHGDVRPKQWYIMNRVKAYELSGFKG